MCNNIESKSHQLFEGWAKGTHTDESEAIASLQKIAAHVEPDAFTAKNAPIDRLLYIFLSIHLQNVQGLNSDQHQYVATVAKTLQARLQKPTVDQIAQLCAKVQALAISQPSVKISVDLFQEVATLARGSSGDEYALELAKLLPYALANMTEEEKMQELRKFIDTPLLSHLLNKVTQENKMLLQELAGALFQQGLLFEAVSKASCGDIGPSHAATEIIRAGICEQLKKNCRAQTITTLNSHDDVSEKSNERTLSIPLQLGGVAPTLQLLCHLVADAARECIENMLGYDNEFFESMQKSVSSQLKSVHKEIDVARRLLHAKIFMHLETEQTDSIKICIPQSIIILRPNAHPQIDRKAMKERRERICNTDNYCQRIIQLMKSLGVHVSKTSQAYFPGKGLNAGGILFSMPSVSRDVSHRAQACVIDLLGIWAGDEDLYIQMAEDKAAVDAPSAIEQYKFLQKNTQKIMGELNAEMNPGLPPKKYTDICTDLTKIFLARLDFTHTNKLLLGQLTRIAEDNFQILGFFLQYCPTLSTYLKSFAPNILSKKLAASLELVEKNDQVVAQAVDRAKMQLYSPSIVLDFLQGLRQALDEEMRKNSEFFATSEIDFVDEIAQTLCNRNTQVRKVIGDGTFPVLTLLASLKAEDCVEKLKTLLSDGLTKRQLMVEIIRYRDTLLTKLRTIGAQYQHACTEKNAGTEQKANCRDRFINELYNILPIYPSSMISIFDISGMDESVHSQLQSQKGLLSPIAKLMQAFVRYGWAAS